MNADEISGTLKTKKPGARPGFFRVFFLLFFCFSSAFFKHPADESTRIE